MENSAQCNNSYRRRVTVTAADGAASADMEDNPHRFGVDVTHDGTRVTSIAGRALRTPWTTCAAAAAVLQALQDTPLLDSPFDVLRQVNQRLHCTHMIDMAALAIAAAAPGGRTLRVYDVALTVSAAGDAIDRRAGTLIIDGGAPEHWNLEDGIIRSPTRFAGLELAHAAKWQGERALGLDDKERIFVMRRAALVSGGARFDLDAIGTADVMDAMLGTCFTFQPVRVDKARRQLGSGRVFASAEDLLDDTSDATS